MSSDKIRAGIVAALVLGVGLLYASSSQAAEGGLCAGLAAAIERSSGLAKLILQVIAGFFGC